MLWFGKHRSCYTRPVDGRERSFVSARSHASIWALITGDRQASARSAVYPLYPVSDVWEPVSFNKEGTRLRKVPGSSDLNDWLLLVITGLNLLHGVKPDSVFVGPPSKVQTKALSLLAGEVSQFFHQCGGVMVEVDWNQKLQARTVGCDGAEVYTAECLDSEKCAQLFLQWVSVVWSMRRISAQVL